MGRKFIRITIPLLLFAILLAARLFFSFQTPFLDESSYQHLVKADDVFEKGIFANPFFYYILSLLFLFTKNVFVLKVFSNIFFVLTNILVYFIALRLSKSQLFSAIAALFSGLLPVYFSSTFNLVSPLSLGLFLLFFNIYAYLNSEKKSWMTIYIISFIIFSFTHWLVILYILGLAVYHLILRLEGIQRKSYELELSLFSIFFGLWAQILVSKKLLFSHGLNLLTFNIPNALLFEYFPKYSLPKVMALLGVVPLIAGLYIIYKYSFEKKGKGISFITSFILITTVLFFFKLLLTHLALMILGLLFCILLARWFSDFKIFAKKAKTVRVLNFFVALLLILIVVVVIPTTIYFTFSEFKTASDSEGVSEALDWLKNSAPESAVVLTLPGEGALVDYFSDREVVITDNFLDFEDIDERLADIYRIYNTRFETEAIDLLDKYDVSYILFSKAAQKRFNIEAISYATGKCLNVVHSDGVIIYFKNPECVLRVV